MLDVEIVGCASNSVAHRVAGRTIHLDFRRNTSPLIHYRESVVHRVPGNLLGDRQPFGLICIKHCRTGPALQDRRQDPAEIDGVGYSGIHSVAGVGNPQMGGVAANESAPVPETIGDQAAADPIFLA